MNIFKYIKESLDRRTNDRAMLKMFSVEYSKDYRFMLKANHGHIPPSVVEAYLNESNKKIR